MSEQTKAQAREILGLPYFCGSEQDAIATALAHMRERRPLSIFTPGATVAARASRDGALFALFREADLLLPDGVGCSLASRLCGYSGLPRIAGIDFAEHLFAACEGDTTRVFLYGGREGVAARAAAHLREKYPHLILSHTDGYGADPYRRIRAFFPHIVCVCLGAGKQEAWIAAHKNEVGGVLIGLGGSLDVWAGEVRRAPRLLQRARLEWAWRTVCQPYRVRRLFPLPAYFVKCLAFRCSSKCQKREEKVDRDANL